MLDLLYKIEENYSNIDVVFSGKRGFHIHVFDFDARDWAHRGQELKRHKVARFRYTKILKSAYGGFNDPHFI